MRKIAATYILVSSQPPLKNSIIILEDDGEIIEVIDTKGVLKEQAGLEFYSGALVPGMINPSNFEKYIQKQLGNPALNLNDLVMENERSEYFKQGEKPGICLITGMDLKNLKLLPTSKIKQLS